MHITKRTLWKMALLMVVTLGIYILYWFIVTKRELNARGAQIPTTFLFIIPIANFYYLYKFSQAFCRQVHKNEQMTVAYFLVIALLMPIGVLIFQNDINNMTQPEHRSDNQRPAW